MINGILYGIGMGVGRPEMLSRQAIGCMHAADVICLPRKEKSECRAYRIAKEAFPGIDGKKLLCFEFEMIRDREALVKLHREIYENVQPLLQQGQKVAFLTIGDPTVYSTFSYIAKLAEQDGFRVEMVNGITSFCACAASLGISLCDGDAELHVISGTENIEEVLNLPGTKVIMKCSRSMLQLRRRLIQLEEESRDTERPAEIYAVSDCGTPEERLYFGAEQLPEDAPYMTTVIVKS